MTDAERAWIVTVWLAGKTQVEMGKEFSVSNTVICIAVKKFCDDWSNRVRRDYSTEESKRVALNALGRWFLTTGEEPSRPGDIRIASPEWHLAMAEHVWLLKAEGLTLQKIKDRTGLSRERIRQKIAGFGRRIKYMMEHHHTHWRIYDDEPYQPPVVRVHQDAPDGRLEVGQDGLSRLAREAVQIANLGLR